MLRTARIRYSLTNLTAPPRVSSMKLNIMRLVDRIKIIIHYVCAMQNFLTRESNRYEVDRGRCTGVSHYLAALRAICCWESAPAYSFLSRLDEHHCTLNVSTEARSTRDLDGDD